MVRLRFRTLALPAVGAAASLALAGVAASHGEPTRAGAASERNVAPLRTQAIAHVNPGGGYNGDVVGHKGFAYLSSWHGRECPGLGVRIFDVRKPTRPARVGTFADAASEPDVRGSWTEKTIVRSVRTAAFRGDLAVTTFQRCGSADSFAGFGLYDVTEPAHPRRLALVRTAPRGSHEIWLAAARGHAWVYTAINYSELESSRDYNASNRTAKTPGKPDFRIFDVSDPRRPVEVAEWGAWKELGVNPRDGRGQFSFNFVHSVMTNPQATRAFLSYWDLGTVILDVSNPARPRYLGRTPAVDGEGDAHSSWLAKNGKVLIETHENAVGRPFFFDISNPRKPRLLSRFGPAGGGNGFTVGVHDPKVLGNRAYFSWYARGVLIANIAKPRKPKLVARFTPPGSPDPERSYCEGSRCSLIWGVYPTKNYVLASDIVGGLWIFRVR